MLRVSSIEMFSIPRTFRVLCIDLDLTLYIYSGKWSTMGTNYDYTGKFHLSKLIDVSHFPFKSSDVYDHSAGLKSTHSEISFTNNIVILKVTLKCQIYMHYSRSSLKCNVYCFAYNEESCFHLKHITVRLAASVAPYTLGNFTERRLP